MLGSFSASIFLKTIAIMVSTTITVIYFIAQHYKHQAKVAWISACAQHYPQFILFRPATITGAALIILGWFANHFYFHTICRDHGINFRTYLPQIPLVLGIMGALFLTISTGLLDTGRHNPKVHTFCASSFFFWTFVACTFNTAISWQIQKQTKQLSQTVQLIKVVTNIVMIALFFMNTFRGSEIETEGGIDDKRGVYIQWTAAYCQCLYFYLMSRDVRKYNFEYELVK